MAVKKAKATASTPRVTPVAIVKPTGNVVVYNTLTKQVELVASNALTSNHKFI